MNNWAEISDWSKNAFVDWLVDASPSLLCAIDGEGTILTVSPAAERLFGYSAKELVGKPVEILVPERFRNVHVLERKAYMLSPTPRPMGKGRDLLARRKDGSEFPVEISLIPRTSENGTFVLTTLNDISERKRAEQKLKESEESFRQLSEAAFEGIVIHRHGVIQLINHSFADLFGYDLPELIGKNVLDICAPEFRELVLTNIQIDYEKPYVAKGIRKDGSSFWGELRGRTTMYRGSAARVTAIRDISERISAEEERKLLLDQERATVVLLQSERECSHFLAEVSKVLAESLNLGTTLKNIARLSVSFLADWCFVVLSNNSTSGYTAFAHKDPEKEELLCGLNGCIPDPQAPEGISRAMRTGLPVIYTDISENMVLPATGSWPLFGTKNPDYLAIIGKLGMKSCLAIPLIVRGKNIGGIIFVSSSLPRRYGPADLTVSQDLAYRAALAIENSQLYAESQKGIQLREDFLSIASHELRTPLAALDMQIQLLNIHLADKIFKDQPKAVVFAKLLQGSSKQLDQFLKLVNDLLDVTRISYGKLNLQLEDLDFSQLVKNVLEKYKEKIFDVGSVVELRAEYPILGKWDPIRIEQVLVNLLTNAMKYGPGKPIRIEVKQEGNSVQLSVEDRGIGIAKMDQERIFERFERAASPKSFCGFGLGLFISREIVQAHGGKIWVESEVGKGSKFLVELPRHERLV